MIGICKCAILRFILPLQSFDCNLDLPQGHFRHVAGGSAQDGDCFVGVEVIQVREIIRIEILPGVIAAPGQRHKCHAAFDRAFQPDGKVLVVQLFQQASGLHRPEHFRIVREVVLYDGVRDTGKTGHKTRLLIQWAEAVFQCLDHSIFILRLQLPQVQGPVLPGVGVGHIEDISKPIPVLRLDQKGDSFGALIDPPAQTVPGADFGAGCSFRFLGVDKKLLPEGVLVIGSGGLQK